MGAQGGRFEGEIGCRARSSLGRTFLCASELAAAYVGGVGLGACTHVHTCAAALS